MGSTCTQASTGYTGFTPGPALPSSAAESSIPSHPMQSTIGLEVMPNYTHLVGERCPVSCAASEETAPGPARSSLGREEGKGWSSSLSLTGELPKSPEDIRAMLEDEFPSTCFQKKQGHEVPRKQHKGSCNSSTKCKMGLCLLVNKIASRFLHPRCSHLFSPTNSKIVCCLAAKAEKEGQEPVFPT